MEFGQKDFTKWVVTWPGKAKSARKLKKSPDQKTREISRKKYFFFKVKNFVKLHFWLF